MTADPALSAPRDRLDPETFRGIFRRHSSSVAVITAGGSRPVGFTATSLTSVSLSPPLISFNLSKTSSSWPTIAGATYVGAHVLGNNQHELASTFARSGADRFASPTAWRRGPHGVPVLDDVLGWMICRIHSRTPAGDHAVVIAEVIDAGHLNDEAPLLYHMGKFRP